VITGDPAAKAFRVTLAPAVPVTVVLVVFVAVLTTSTNWAKRAPGADGSVW
jgi:hypothetical protein